MDGFDNRPKYDSTADTLKHIKRVNELLLKFSEHMLYRASVHDSSKLEEPEKSLFDKFTPLLANCTYGSEEYNEYLKELKPALDHHYANNRHHPEAFIGGILGMNLMDIVEMLVDWKAASERHNDGDIMKSIGINQKRFGYSDDLAQIFRNTAVVLFQGYSPEPSDL